MLYSKKFKDFGLAKKSAKMTSKSKCGTLVYNPPEMIERKWYNHTSDWYSLGIIAYELTTGKVPFMSSNEVLIKKKIKDGKISFNSRFSKPLEKLIKQLIKKNPKKRLGANGVKEIKNHIYFQGVDWDMVLHKKYQILDLKSLKKIKNHIQKEEYFSRNMNSTIFQLDNTSIQNWSYKKVYHSIKSLQ